MRVEDPQLRDVLDHDEPLGGRGEAEQGAEERRLPGATRTGDEDVRPGGDRVTQQLGDRRRERPGGLQRIEPQRFVARHPDGQQRPTGRHRREDHVDPHPVLQPHVDARRRLVDMPPASRHQAHRERTDGRLIGAPPRLPDEPGTVVEPEAGRTVDEEIGDPRIGEVWSKSPEVGERRDPARLGRTRGFGIDRRFRRIGRGGLGRDGDDEAIGHAASVGAPVRAPQCGGADHATSREWSWLWSGVRRTSTRLSARSSMRG